MALEAGRSDSPIAKRPVRGALQSLNSPQCIAIVRPGSAQNQTYSGSTELSANPLSVARCFGEKLRVASLNRKRVANTV